MPPMSASLGDGPIDLLLQRGGEQYEGDAECEVGSVLGGDDSSYLDQGVVSLDVERHPRADVDSGPRARDDAGAGNRNLYEVGLLWFGVSTETLCGDGGRPRNGNRCDLDSLA